MIIPTVFLIVRVNMKVIFTSRWIALALLTFLITFAPVLIADSERCSQIFSVCPRPDVLLATPMVHRVLETGQETSPKIRCRPGVLETELGDEFEWFRTTSNNSASVVPLIRGDDKYNMSDANVSEECHILSECLYVINVTSADDGLYFCRIKRNGVLLTMQWKAACLYANRPVAFASCSGEGNEHIPLKGCSKTEVLTKQVGESVEFSLSLTYEGSPDSCSRDTVVDVVLKKVEPPRDDTVLGYCTTEAVNCTVNTRVTATPRTSINQFDNITLTLNNLALTDSGNYTVKALRDVRILVSKNFTLVVAEKPTEPEPTTEQTEASTPSGSSLPLNILIPIVAVIVVLVGVLIGLFVFVASLMLWTCNYRSKPENDAESKLYSTIGDKNGELRYRRKKKHGNGVVSEDSKAEYRHSRVEDNLDEVKLEDDGLNSTTNAV